MTNYYLRKSGNDGNDGLTPSTAWLTVGKANISMSDGDTIYIGPGDWSTENIQPSTTNWSNRTWIGDPKGEITGDAPGDVKVKGLYDNGHSFPGCVFRWFYFVGYATGLFNGVYVTIIPDLTSSFTLDYCKINKSVRIENRGSIYFRNNVVNLDRISGGESVRLWSNSYTSDIEVDAYNNTIYSASSTPGYSTLKIDVYSPGNISKVATINSYNNIIITSSGASVYGTFYNGWHSPIWGGYTNYNTDYNFHSYIDKCMEVADRNFDTGVTTYNYYNTLSDAKAAGYDVNSLEGDPLLEIDKYHLKRISLCIDKGTDVGVIEDIDGESRPKNVTYDIGVDERKILSPPVNCLASDGVQTRVYVYWEDNLENWDVDWEYWFNIYRDGILIGTVQSSEHTFNDYTGEADRVYTYCVKAQDIGMETSASCDTGVRPKMEFIFSSIEYTLDDYIPEKMFFDSVYFKDEGDDIKISVSFNQGGSWIILVDTKNGVDYSKQSMDIPIISRGSGVEVDISIKVPVENIVQFEDSEVRKEPIYGYVSNGEGSIVRVIDSSNNRIVKDMIVGMNGAFSDMFAPGTYDIQFIGLPQNKEAEINVNGYIIKNIVEIKKLILGHSDTFGKWGLTSFEVSRYIENSAILNYLRNIEWGRYLVYDTFVDESKRVILNPNSYLNLLCGHGKLYVSFTSIDYFAIVLGK